MLKIFCNALTLRPSKNFSKRQEHDFLNLAISIPDSSIGPSVIVFLSYIFQLIYRVGVTFIFRKFIGNGLD